MKGPEIPDPSGQLTELIVYITSDGVDLYSHQILLTIFRNLTLKYSWHIILAWLRQNQFDWYSESLTDENKQL